MQALWSLGEASTREVLDHLVDRHPVTYMTIKTTLDRLVEKDLASKERTEPAFRYRAVLPKDVYGEKIVNELLTWLGERYPAQLDEALRSRSMPLHPISSKQP